MNAQDILNWWPIAAALVAAVVWNVRLEGKVFSQGEALKAAQIQIATHAETAVQIARLEEQIKGLTEQMRAQTDLIRQLLPKSRQVTREG